MSQSSVYFESMQALGSFKTPPLNFVESWSSLLAATRSSMETDDWRNPSKGSPLRVWLTLLLVTGSVLQRAFDSMAPKLSTTIEGVIYFLTPKAEDNTSSLQAAEGKPGGGGGKAAAGKAERGRTAKGGKDVSVCMLSGTHSSHVGWTLEESVCGVLQRPAEMQRI